MVSLCESDMDMLRELCSRCLRNVSFHTMTRTQMVQEGVCGCLAALANTPDEKVKEDCAVALCNLTREESVHVDMIKENIVPTLIALSKSQGAETQRQISIALCNLTKQPTLRWKLAEEGVVPALTMLARSDNDDTKITCSIALRNLSSHPGSQARMVEDGALHLLIDLMVVKDAEAKMKAAGESKSSGAGGKREHSILPTPPVEWSGGTPAAAADELVVPPLQDKDVEREMKAVRAMPCAFACTCYTALCCDVADLPFPRCAMFDVLTPPPLHASGRRRLTVSRRGRCHRPCLTWRRF